MSSFCSDLQLLVQYFLAIKGKEKKMEHFFFSYTAVQKLIYFIFYAHQGCFYLIKIYPSKTVILWNIITIYNFIKKINCTI